MFWKKKSCHLQNEVDRLSLYLDIAEKNITLLEARVRSLEKRTSTLAFNLENIIEYNRNIARHLNRLKDSLVNQNDILLAIQNLELLHERVEKLEELTGGKDDIWKANK